MTIQLTSPLYPNLHHVGIVVRSIEETGKDNAERFGLGPVTGRFRFRAEQTLYRGARVSFSADFGYIELGTAVMELIQPIGTDPSPFLDALRDRGETLHHLAFVVPSIDEHLAAARKTNHACTVVIDAPLMEGQGRFAYVEGLIHGSLTELIEIARKAG
jgi:hypothetical protein